MASNINVMGLNEKFPQPGVNQSSQGFRDNFSIIKSNLIVARNEIDALHDRRLVITGDVLGVSDSLGTSVTIGTTQKAFGLNVTLRDVFAPTTGGTADPNDSTLTIYDTTNKNVTLTIDSKGRVVAATETPKPTRPAVQGAWATVEAPVVTPNAGHVSSITFPNTQFAFDEYGTLVSVGAPITANFGIIDHPLTKGSLLVGNAQGRSAAMPVHSPVNVGETWVLTIDQYAPNGLRWVKLPDWDSLPYGVSEVKAGKGINVDQTDPEKPVVALDLNTLDAYPHSSVQTLHTLIPVYDQVNNQSYLVEYEDLFDFPTINPGDYLTKVQDDPAPRLGGDLDAFNKKIFSSDLGGLNIESEIIKLNQMRWPQIGAFQEGNFLRINSAGIMYWDTVNVPDNYVADIDAGAGIRVTDQTITVGDPNIPGNVITTNNKVVEVSMNTLPVVTSVNAESNYMMVQSASGPLEKTLISNVIPSIRSVVFVSAENGNDSSPTAGRLATPFKTIQAAINAISVGFETRIMLMPGVYTENVVINKPNVRIGSFFGRNATRIRGRVTVEADMGETHISGINLYMLGNTSDFTTWALDVPNGVDSLYVSDCYLGRAKVNYPTAVVRLAGEQTGVVRFSNCEIDGLVRISMTYDGADVDEDRIFFDGITGDIANSMALETLANTRVFVNNVSFMNKVTHTGGFLTLQNIANLTGQYLLLPDDPPPSSIAAVNFEGIVSTANADPSNFLRLTNVNLKITRPFGANTVIHYAKIVKTGTCAYSFANVARHPPVDTLNGTRAEYAGAVGVDIGETVVTRESTGASLTVNSDVSRTWDLTLTENVTLTLAASTTVYSGFVDTVTVVLRQDGAGTYTVNWLPSDIVWEGGSAPSVPTGVGATCMFKFMRVNGTWFGQKIFN